MSPVAEARKGDALVFLIRNIASELGVEGGVEVTLISNGFGGESNFARFVALSLWLAPGLYPTANEFISIAALPPASVLNNTCGTYNGNPAVNNLTVAITNFSPRNLSLPEASTVLTLRFDYGTEAGDLLPASAFDEIRYQYPDALSQLDLPQNYTQPCITFQFLRPYFWESGETFTFTFFNMATCDPVGTTRIHAQFIGLPAIATAIISASFQLIQGD